ncbi:Heterochromatin-associated protein [Globisporangium polare]
MAAEIERIVDKKPIRGRVHYLVVWRGFGEESNTWESRMDLMADGYSSVIREFENSNKKSRDGSATPNSSRSRSPSRGRSPGRPKGSKNRVKTGAESKSPSRGRSRSNSVSRVRRKPASENQESSAEEVPLQKKAPVSKSKPVEVSEPVEPVVFVPETQHQLQPHSDEDTDVLLRSTIKALNTHVIKTATPVEKDVDVATTPRKSPRMKASPKSVKTETQTISLAYEEDGRVVKQTTQTIETTTETVAHGHSHGHSHESSSSTSTTVVTAEAQQLVEEEVETSALLHRAPRARAQGGFVDMITKMTERGWIVSFLSVAVVVGSLLASQILPRDVDSDLWRAWLPFLTPIVALLLFFHQKDDRASAKWIAIALSWRCAAELLVLIGATPSEFQTVTASAAAIANLSLLIALGALVRNKEHEASKATLVALAAAAFALFLADSWVVTTKDPALESRVILMSVAVLGISLSPALTASTDDDDE